MLRTRSSSRGLFASDLEVMEERIWYYEVNDTEVNGRSIRKGNKRRQNARESG